MTNIFLCGKSNDNSISYALLSALQKYGGVQYCSSDRAVRLGNQKLKFLIYDCENLPNIELEKGIILFKNSFTFTKKSFIPNTFLCVLEMKNTHALKMLEGTGKVAITYGTSAKDTLSFAGLNDTNAIVSLQRNVITLDGKMLEPHDFTINLLSDSSPSRILAVCAVLLLSGQDSSQGFDI